MPRHAVVGLGVVLCVVVQVWALFFVEYGAPRIGAGSEIVWLGEVAGPVTVAQTFRMKAAGLSGVSIRVRPAGPSPRADLDLVVELAEIDEARQARPLFRKVEPVGSALTAAWYRVEFPPLPDSQGKRYRVQVAVPHAIAGEGLEVLASREPRYGEGAAFLAGRERWGDLAFATTATTSTAFRRLEAALADQPWVFRSRMTLLSAFLVFNLGLFACLRLAATACERRPA